MPGTEVSVPSKSNSTAPTSASGASTRKSLRCGWGVPHPSAPRGLAGGELEGVAMRRPQALARRALASLGVGVCVWIAGGARLLALSGPPPPRQRGDRHGAFCGEHELRQERLLCGVLWQDWLLDRDPRGVPGAAQGVAHSSAVPRPSRRARELLAGVLRSRLSSSPSSSSRFVQLGRRATRPEGAETWASSAPAAGLPSPRSSMAAGAPSGSGPERDSAFHSTAALPRPG
mmetsp:Transcript_87004/g.246338  ORF Transcript_87004/g.246338 Transcript_87004/m.246338 type:complete len:231 (+) Transcript_87004:348-1040(+)